MKSNKCCTFYCNLSLFKNEITLDNLEAINDKLNKMEWTSFIDNLNTRSEKKESYTLLKNTQRLNHLKKFKKDLLLSDEAGEGFGASTWTKGNDIVISYRGSKESKDFLDHLLYFSNDNPGAIDDVLQGIVNGGTAGAIAGGVNGSVNGYKNGYEDGGIWEGILGSLDGAKNGVKNGSIDGAVLGAKVKIQFEELKKIAFNIPSPDIHAQDKQAVHFLLNNVDNYGGRKYYITGHSLGGRLALVANDSARLLGITPKTRTFNPFGTEKYIYPLSYDGNVTSYVNKDEALFYIGYGPVDDDTTVIADYGGENAKDRHMMKHMIRNYGDSIIPTPEKITPSLSAPLSAEDEQAIRKIIEDRHWDRIGGFSKPVTRNRILDWNAVNKDHGEISQYNISELIDHYNTYKAETFHKVDVLNSLKAQKDPRKLASLTQEDLVKLASKDTFKNSWIYFEGDNNLVEVQLGGKGGFAPPLYIPNQKEWKITSDEVIVTTYFDYGSKREPYQIIHLKRNDKQYYGGKNKSKFYYSKEMFAKDEQDKDKNNLEPFSLFKNPFTSGYSGLYRNITINSDGSFSGNEQKMYPESGNGFDGTLYLTEFKGSFINPKKISDFEYQFEVGNLDYITPDETIKNGIRHVPTESYFVKKGAKFTLYLPGKQVDEEMKRKLFSGLFNSSDVIDNKFTNYIIVAENGHDIKSNS